VADASVRTAQPDDAASIASVQAAAWRATYGNVLPADVLEDLDSPAVHDQWREAVTTPPSARHRVLVAMTGADVVGFAAIGPSEDSDLVAMVDAEMSALCVLPDRVREGHGSRLVNAAVDHLRTDGFLHVRVWLAAGAEDERLHAFLAGAGWAEDGARRELDLHGDGRVVVPQVRLHAAIGTAP
jgi:GNAT superfamily N-acetyltransferase